MDEEFGGGCIILGCISALVQFSARCCGSWWSRFVTQAGQQRPSSASMSADANLCPSTVLLFTGRRVAVLDAP